MSLGPALSDASERPAEDFGIPNRGVPSGIIHLGVVRHIIDVLADLGADPVPILRNCGLGRHSLSDPDRTISFEKLGHLLRCASEATRCPHLGLLVGQKSTLQSLRAVGLLMRASDTLGDALRSMKAHLRFQNRGAVTNLEVEGDAAVLTYSLYDPSGLGACQILDGGLATAIQVMRELAARPLAPLEVLVPRRHPADPGPYRELFRAPVRFDQEMAALVFPRVWLSQPVPTANSVLRRALELQIVGCEQACAPDLKDEMRRLLRAELIKSRFSAASTADRLAMHRRTLNRHLKDEGTSYKLIADELRFGIARQLLADTDLPLAEISATLDFSEPAAFTRAFHRWSGCAPSLWRTQHRP